MDDLITQYGALQATFASLVAFLPFGYAFGAGMIASVNPCGFLVLPSFGLYYLGLDADTTVQVPWHRRLGRALLAGGMATLGFMVLFGSIGFVIALAGRTLLAISPAIGIGIGIASLILGIWIVITNRTFGLTALDRFGLPAGTGPWPAFLFGLAYGALSLACTLPIFLVVVGASTTGSLLGALGQFAAYALGMGVVITLVAISAALAGGAFARALARVRPWVPRIAGVFLILAGAFVVYYWLGYGQLLA